MDFHDFESDNSDYENETPIDVNTNTVVVIDTAESMFQPSSLHNGSMVFQVALKALYKVNDELIFAKTTRNKVATLTFHENSTNRVLMDFETPFLEGLLKLKNLSDMNVEDLKDFKTTDSKPNFGNFLMEAIKMLKKIPGTASSETIKQIYFITNNPDPCFGDAKLKFQSLQEFKDMKELKIFFNVLLMSEDFDMTPFYGEAFEILGKQPPKFYYDITCLISTISNGIKFKSMKKNLKIYPALLSERNLDMAIHCVMKKYATDVKLAPTKSVTRDLKQEVRRAKDVNKSNKTYKLLLGSESMTITKEERNELLDTDYAIGLTVTYATVERVSTPGINLETPVLISAKNPDDDIYKAFWEAAVKNNLRLIGALKYRQYSRVYTAELTPTMVKQERQFIMITLPSSLNIRDPEYDERKVVKNDEIAVMEELINKTSIENYDCTKIRPYTYIQQVKYFKKELLGSDYAGATEYMDLLNDKLYPADIEDIIKKLNEMYKEGDSGKGKRTKAKAAGKPPAKRTKI